MPTKNSLEKLLQNIRTFIPDERIFTDDLRRVAYSSDASAYSLLPKAVILAANEPEAQMVIGLCFKLGIPLTFRGAGTSLSGQSISDSILLVADRSWNRFHLSEDKKRITMQPAALGGNVNRFLKKYDKKIGPDPASINAATIGGIAANNSSGMTSGTLRNCYNTLVNLRVILPDGSLLDTSSSHSKKEFLRLNKKLVNSISEITGTINSNELLKSKIAEKYKIKNTTGYGINSFVDFSDPLEIIAHLMIGSEGTLGFISEITLETVPDLPLKATAFVIFDEIATACELVQKLADSKVEAAEIMNSKSIKLLNNKHLNSRFLKNSGDNSAALLIETSALTEKVLKKNCSNIQKIFSGSGINNVEFIFDPTEQKIIWDLRKGLFPSVCKERENGTTVIIEDVNFRIEDLASAAKDIEYLFDKYSYQKPVIWGHALSGNLHFTITSNFSETKEIKKYSFFMDDLTRLVIDKYRGSLKAEHGTGRNIAPFVKREWGEEIYGIMCEIKNLFDRSGILNPDVIISGNSSIHLGNLKHVPVTGKSIDKCIECGFCEEICPSKNITLTPRQRIIVWREIQKLSGNSDSIHLKKNLIKDFDYFGIDTCAADGLCSLNCPVDIDTGYLMKQLRNARITPAVNSLSKYIAKNFGAVITLFGYSLSAIHFFKRLTGTRFLTGTAAVFSRISKHNIPEWSRHIPTKSILKFNSSIPTKQSVVYFPSCVSRVMGPADNSAEESAQSEIIIKLLQKAGFDILYPENMENLCCGQPFESKGFFSEADRKSDELYNELLKTTWNGKFPVLFDTSPCSLRMKKYISSLDTASVINIFDSVEFIDAFLLKNLKIEKKFNSVALHVTCSSKKMGQDEKLLRIASLCSESVVIPENISCCGFAGDKGFRFPELNKSALETLEKSVHNCQTGFSTSRTCEIGLSRHSGIEYKSIFYLLNECAVSPDTKAG